MSDHKKLTYTALILSGIALIISLNSNKTDTAYISKQEFLDLRNNYNTLSTQYDQLKQSLVSLSFDYYLSQNKTANFSATDTSFRLLNTAYGNLLVSLKNAEKHGDGYQLTFEFGNPTSMTIAGLKGKVKWGPKVDWNKYYKDSTYKNDVDTKTDSKNFDVLSDLYPGTWNQATIIVGPATEEQIGAISLSEIVSNSVKMRMIPHY